MRVLVVSTPLQGHLLPLIPFAAACRDAGHDVLIASGGEVLGLDLEGLPRRDIAPGFRIGQVATPVMLRHPVLAAREMAGRAGLDMVGRMFGAANAAFAEAAVAAAERYRAELVVYEPLSAAGAIVADRLGVPSVLLESNLFDAPELLAVVAASPPMRRFRFAAPTTVITSSPPSLVGARAGRPMRAAAYSGGGEVPDWLLEDRPRIVVSRSTIAGPGGGDPAKSVAAAAPGVAAEIVLVRPGKAYPAVRTVGRVPLDCVLPHATAFVHHGGAGSVLAALAAGVPQLIVPGMGDRRHNAVVVARRGAGLGVDARAIDAAVLTWLISDESLRAAAQQVRDEIAAMPAPAAVVAQVIPG
jgi:hypothetical protein